VLWHGRDAGNTSIETSRAICELHLLWTYLILSQNSHFVDEETELQQSETKRAQVPQLAICQEMNIDFKTLS
jgi:hypothetical protein